MGHIGNTVPEKSQQGLGFRVSASKDSLMLCKDVKNGLYYLARRLWLIGIIAGVWGFLEVCLGLTDSRESCKGS